MVQDLFYTPESSSLVLFRSTNPNPYYWYNIDRLEVSASLYDAKATGSNFDGTVGALRYYAYSGSVLIVSLPVDGTNLYYPPFPNPLDLNSYLFPSVGTEVFSAFYWNLDIDPNFSLASASGSGMSIYDLTTSSSVLVFSGESSTGGFPIISGNNYIVAVTGSGSFTSYITINNVSSGSTVIDISGSSGIVSASFNPIEFNDYAVTFSIIDNSAP